MYTRADLNCPVLVVVLEGRLTVGGVPAKHLNTASLADLPQVLEKTKAVGQLIAGESLASPMKAILRTAACGRKSGRRRNTRRHPVASTRQLLPVLGASKPQPCVLNPKAILYPSPKLLCNLSVMQCYQHREPVSA